MATILASGMPDFDAMREELLRQEPWHWRLLKFALVLLVHGALLGWLFEQQVVALHDAVIARMDVRVIEPPVEKARPLPPKPKVSTPPPVAPPPVMTAAPDNAPATGGFAVAPQSPAPREVPAAAVTAPVRPAPAAPAVAVAPVPAVTAARFDAEYLNNPPPVYPSLSRRLREEGQVLLMVHVSADGAAVAVHVRQGSGFERLDEAALAAVRQWRFVPARRGPQAIAATVLVPIVFTLKAA